MKERTKAHLRPQNLTVRRIPSTQDCYGFKFNSSIPAPERMEFKSVSMRKPGRTRQEVIQRKSPISLKLCTNVGFDE